MSKVHVIESSVDGNRDYELFTSKRTACEYGIAIFKQYLIEELHIINNNIPSFPFTEDGIEKASEYANKMYTAMDIYDENGDEYNAPPYVVYRHIAINSTSILSQTVFYMMKHNYMIRERGFEYDK